MMRVPFCFAGFALAASSAFGQCGSSHSLTVTEAYVINGVPRPELTFIAGDTYTFTCMNTLTHPFMVTLSDTGGSSAQPLPMSMGVSCQCTACATCATTTITWHVPDNFSDQNGPFYYQCKVHHSMGTNIFILSRPAISDQPDPQNVCDNDPLTLTLVADTSDHAPLIYQWRKNGQVISGANSPTYFVAHATAANSGTYDCIVSNQCVSTTSTPVMVHVGCCPGDFDHDGFVTGADYDLYVAAFEAGDPSADFDGDGFITGVDFDLYVVAFEAGC